MKKDLRHILLWLSAIFIVLASSKVSGQVINADYVKKLYAKYPTVKSDLCPACKLWINPYYKSIADTVRHMPIVTYAFYTKANYAKVAVLKVPRTGIYAAWHPVAGQVNEDNVYTAANKIVKPTGGEIAKGHCQAWILNAYSYDSAILSDTYTFNAACEDQAQNIGTEIYTENLTRQLLKDNDVEVWCGTFGSEATFTDGKVTDTEPAFYWKAIKVGNRFTCFWMPNLRTENQAQGPKREITYIQLIQNLGFDPKEILK